MRFAIGRGVAALCLCWLAVEPTCVTMADTGLLIVAHGSPRSDWNQPVIDVGAKVAEEAVKSGQFKAVRVGMLEAAEPTIPTAIAELEAAGCDRIVAVPLFIAPSSHSLFDVPTMLGIYSSPSELALLKSEGATPATPKVPIQLTQTLSEGDVLSDYVLSQVREVSRTPSEEAIVVLAHGDPEHQPAIERLLRKIATRCCGETGIKYGDWACIGVGQEYASEGVAAIKRAAEGGKRKVLVVGLYLSTSANDLHDRAAKMAAAGQPSAHGAARDPLQGLEVRFSTLRLTSDPTLVKWVLDTAQAAQAAQQPAKPLAQNASP